MADAGISGYVNAAGESAIPDELRAMASIGSDAELSPEAEAMLEGLLDATTDYAELKAKYKLEIMFTEERSAFRPYGGMVYAMSNGGYAHGGGDEIVHFCTAQVERKGEYVQCNHPLDMKWVGKDNALCPKCRNVIVAKDLLGQIYAKLHHQQWAELVYRVFCALGGNADIRLGTMKGDLRKATLDGKDGGHLNERLTGVRVSREWVVYPLTTLLQDTSSGADARSRLRAFMSA